jgi:hypothetical protein
MTKYKQSIPQRLGRDAFIQETGNRNGEDFLRALIYLAGYGNSRAALKNIADWHNLIIPQRFAIQYGSTFRGRKVFECYYNVEPSFTSSIYISLVYSRRVGCGLCISEDAENGFWKNIHEFDVVGRRILTKGTVRAALEYLAEQPHLPTDFTNYATSLCGCNDILAVFSAGAWKDRIYQESWPQYADDFRTHYKEEKPPGTVL